MPPNAIIRINRQAAYWRDTLRAYKVVVDGEEVGRIRDGETLDFVVPPGSHRLRLKIDWTGSKELTFLVRHGEIRSFSSSPFQGLAIVTLLRSIFQHDRYITLRDDGSLRA
jgi:hypothetical protein